ncbi:hypothetical protein ACVWXQ_004639 [Bradyrhizobium sp. S3.14.4]
MMVDMGVVERQQIGTERRAEDENQNDDSPRKRKPVPAKAPPCGLAGRELSGREGRSRHS